MPFPLRRVLLGFTVGAAAGWAAGLLRTPSAAPAGSSAEGALRLPQEEFGEPVSGEREHAPPRKATGPSIRPTPGAPHPETGQGDAEPAVPAHGDAAPAGTAHGDAASAVTATAAEALREGHAAATEALAEAAVAPEPVKPARRRAPAKKPAKPAPEPEA
jgi:hypothetical protein